MIPLPHPTDYMTDEQKQAYWSQQTITRELHIPIDAVGGRIGTVNPSNDKEVDKANEYL